MSGKKKSTQVEFFANSFTASGEARDELRVGCWYGRKWLVGRAEVG